MFGYFVSTSYVMRSVCLIAIRAFLSSALYNVFGLILVTLYFNEYKFTWTSY